jgi:acetylglutamate kinase
VRREGAVKSQIEKINILFETLPYIRKFAGTTVVIKFGGHAMVSEQLKKLFAEDVVFLKFLGINPVVVHGGGPQIGAMMERLGLKPRFVDGHRITDEETMDIVEMVLVGKVNQEIVGLINRHGGCAVGLSGKDANLIRAEKYYLSDAKVKETPSEIIDIGLVGKVKGVNAELITTLMADGVIPVIAPTGIGDGGETYNINADLVAGAVASALAAEKLILLTDVPGVLNGNKELIHAMNERTTLRMIEEGTIEGGMFPKVKCCLKALRGGVKKAHIVDGRLKHTILLEMFTDQGIGTEIVL